MKIKSWIVGRGALASLYLLSLYLLMTITPTEAAASEDLDANFVMPGCRAWLQNDVLYPGSGFCAGLVTGILFAEYLHEAKDDKSAVICSPKTVTPNEAIRVVATHIEAHPELMHQRFDKVAMTALTIAWPCKHTSSPPPKNGRR
jgi:Rap1a immunity proteins